MPIRENEKFGAHFIADTKEEAASLLKKFDTDLSMQAHKFSTVTGVDKFDLRQEGIIGLARASRDFEKDRSENFRIFAIYKIRDAMREFVTGQAGNIKVPQYIRDAQRLSIIMRGIMEKIGGAAFIPTVDLWQRLVAFKPSNELEESLKKDIEDIKSSIKNLADRSHTSVPQILERAEMMPSSAFNTSVDLSIFDIFDIGYPSEEDKMVERIYARDKVAEIKGVLTEEEFELLYDRFVDDKTLKMLEPKLGIKEETIVIRTNNILTKLRRKFDHEGNTNTKKIGA